MKKLVVISILLPLKSSVVMAQTNADIWWQVFNNFVLDSSKQIVLDAGYRHQFNNLIYPKQYFVRAGYKYNINPQNSIAAGIACFNSISYATGLSTQIFEKRIWQEVNLKLPFKAKNNFFFRVRVEQRFFENLVNNQQTFALRVRLKNSANFKVNKTLSFHAYNEYMLQGNNAKIYFDQNRVYAGGHFLLNKSTSLGVGVMSVLKYEAALPTTVMYFSFYKNK